MNPRILFGETNSQPGAVSHVVLGVPHPAIKDGKVITRMAYRGLCMSSSSGWEVISTDTVPHGPLCTRCVKRWKQRSSHISWHITAQS